MRRVGRHNVRRIASSSDAPHEGALWRLNWRRVGRAGDAAHVVARPRRTGRLLPSRSSPSAPHRLRTRRSPPSSDRIDEFRRPTRSTRASGRRTRSEAWTTGSPYGRRSWSSTTRAGRAWSRRCAASTCGSRPARSSASSGPNGAGKSTTVRMLTTLLSITAGHARTSAGVDVAPRPGRARAGGWASRCRRPGWTRARPAASCSSCRGGCSACRQHDGRRARRGAARARRARGRRRPAHQGLLGRHEAPARPRVGARARAARCCSSTSRRPAWTRRAG